MRSTVSTLLMLVAALSTGAAVAGQTATQSTPWSLVLPAASFTDADIGDILRYEAFTASGEALPRWLNFDAKTVAFSGTPDAGSVGLRDLVVRATDLVGASVDMAFQLEVIAARRANHAPILLSQQLRRSQSKPRPLPSLFLRVRSSTSTPTIR